MFNTVKPLIAMIEFHRQERDLALLRAQAMVPRQLGLTISKEALRSSLVKVIAGPRRSGKSTLGFQLLQDKSFAYLNFEDDSFYKHDINSDELVEVLEVVYGKTEFFFFDEIQNFPHWESFINKLHRRGRNIVITGSNSRLLSRELGSALTGRHLLFELLPFSFPEVLAGKQNETSNDAELFERYLVWGGFPEVVLAGVDPASYLKTLFDSVVLRDIVTRHRIRSSTALHDLLSLLINNAAARFSARSLERSLGSLSTATIQKFISYSREAYVIQDLQPYSFKTKLRVKADRKIYAFDNGFISANSQPASSNISRLLENLVFVELTRRGFRANIDLFYYQTSSGTETDFLLRQGSKNLELVQVSQDLSALKTRERELRALCQAAQELNVKHLTIVTMKTEDVIQEPGMEIRVVPCRKWLQQKENDMLY